MALGALLIPAITSLLDKIIPDPEARDRAKIELMKSERASDLEEMNLSMSAILAEANSADPWTSRARPSFMYIFYFVILALVIIAPLVGVFFPEHMDKFFVNTAKGFAAIPEPMWWTFSAGYLGYTGMRGYEKSKGVTK